MTGVHPLSRYGELSLQGSLVNEFNEKPLDQGGFVAAAFLSFSVSSLIISPTTTVAFLKNH